MCLVPNIVGGLCCATRRVNSCSDEDCLSTLPALLRLGADLEAKDRNGKTPLFQCKDNETALQLLLAAGANVDIIYSQKPRSIGTCFSSLRSSFVSLFFDRVGTGTEESNKKKKKRNKEQEARKGKKSALAFIAQFFSEYVIPLCFFCATPAPHTCFCVNNNRATAETVASCASLSPAHVYYLIRDGWWNVAATLLLVRAPA